MKSFYQHTTSRHAASLMLALWLLVLGSGFANACLLKAPDHRGYHSTVNDVEITNYAVESVHESEPSSEAPCLKACDEGSQALKSINDKQWVDPGYPPLTGGIWTDSPHLLSRQRGLVETLSSQSDPPKRIIYSRWAL